MTSSSSDLPLRATDLVLHYNKSLAQAARILGSSVPAVQKFVQQYLDRYPQIAGPRVSPDSDSAFVSVTLDAAEIPPPVSPSPPVPIPLDIRIRTGLELHIRLSSLDDGFVIWYKRLEKGTFRLTLPDAGQNSITLTRAQLAMLLEGIDFFSTRHLPSFSV